MIAEKYLVVHIRGIELIFFYYSLNSHHIEVFDVKSCSGLLQTLGVFDFTLIKVFTLRIMHLSLRSENAFLDLCKAYLYWNSLVSLVLRVDALVFLFVKYLLNMSLYLFCINLRSYFICGYSFAFFFSIIEWLYIKTFKSNDLQELN